MAQNDFLPFAVGTGANVESQSAYAAEASTNVGFSAGLAASAKLNKAWRQSSVIASAIAQLAVDKTGLDMLDNGDVTTTKARLLAMLRAVTIQIVKRPYTANGTYTPSPGMIYCEVEIVGGGGGSGGSQGGSSAGAAGGGGGAGGYAKKIYTAAQIGVNQPIAIGAGGAASIAAGGPTGNGGNGGPSTFMSMIAAGGVGGEGSLSTSSFGSNAAGGIGGNATGGDINLPGQPGGNGIAFGANGGMSGAGGSCPFGTGGASGYPTNGGGVVPRGYGAGASGAASTTTTYAGAAGAQGFGMITEYCSQ